ncbi:MAG: LuxR C-terminal-related transcriptional regulator [Flavobacteriaceae bacterium]|nr:LuxR C-terminal-related transcriptional regulator [Flavobacteriaceae bacterium]
MKGLFRSYRLYVFLYFALFNSVTAQELPLVSSFEPAVYNGESQNWGFSQAKDGHLYVANNRGLLSYNGATWHLYETPNETIMRSVKVVKDRIYTGFYMDFGYWTRKENGILYYTSLVDIKQIEIEEDEQFWNIQHVQDWIVFQSLSRIHIIHPENKTYFKIESSTKIPQLFAVNQQLFFQQMGKGLFQIINGNKKLISEENLFKHHEIVGLFSHEEALLVVTKDKGVYLLNEEELKPWNVEVNILLKGKTLYSSCQTKNGSIVLGTISNGAIFLNADGKQLYNLSRKNSLLNNTVLSIYEDANQVIWLGLDNGISRVEMDSAFMAYTDNKGDLGTVYAAIQFNGLKYLGTNQGLFVQSEVTKDAFDLVPGTQGQVWSLHVINGELFCGHDLGTFIIDNKKIKQYIAIAGTWKLLRINKNSLLQGNYTGLYVLERKESLWQIKHKIKGFENSSKSFEIYKGNKVIVNHEYKGVFILELDAKFENVKNIYVAKNVEKGLHSDIVLFDRSLLYANKKGVFRYVDSLGDFQLDKQLSKFYNKKNYTSGKLQFTPKSRVLWSFSNKHMAFTEQNNLIEELRIKSIPISNKIRKGAAGYENISQLDNDNYIIGRKDGYLVFNKRKWIQEENQDFAVRINSVLTNKLNQSSTAKSLVENGLFHSKENNVSFSYHIPHLTKDRSVEYQFRLIGHNENWSDWSSSPFVLFENLSYGSYTFEVKAKLGNIENKQLASYSFQIKHPWYLSNLAIIVYVLFLLFLIWMVNKLYTSYYRKQRENMLQEQEREFALTNLAKEKELMQLKNEQLKSDVLIKNREFATSTMNIVKKNELLSEIKSALLQGGAKNIKQVVRIIDKNLNNEDDWRLFLEAFNNADKDFIKKLKLAHSDLTPNDLRLCAYLRLNLSSKEIAPLLNISTKSVEVKRYRLRKKMELDHNINLTTYILEL